MRRSLLALLTLLVVLVPVQAAGLLIPQDKTLPPLAMLDHKVTIAIEDQVAVTRVEQTFRNHTPRQLEATYIFPVPKGASVNKFTMWVDGKETKGELVRADKARQIYTSIVRRTQDPGLLEYIGNDLLAAACLPGPCRTGDQKVSLSFTSVASKDGKLIEYVYPLKTDGRAVETLEKFSIQATVKSQHGLTNVYSPSHALTLKRISDKEVIVSFDKDQGALDRDFQLFYSTGQGRHWPDRLDASADQRRQGLLHLAHLSQDEPRREKQHPPGYGAGAGHLRQHARPEDGAGPQGAEILHEPAEAGRSLRPDRLRHHGQPLRGQAAARLVGAGGQGEQMDRRTGGDGRHRHQRCAGGGTASSAR